MSFFICLDSYFLGLFLLFFLETGERGRGGGGYMCDLSWEMTNCSIGVTWNDTPVPREEGGRAPGRVRYGGI